VVRIDRYSRVDQNSFGELMQTIHAFIQM